MVNKIKEALPEIVSRLVIGSVFIQSGWGKFGDLGKVVGYFESLGIPLAQFQAPFVAGIELVAGILILTGFFTRVASIPLIVIMSVAIRTAKWEDVTGFSSLTELSEFLYIVILLWLLARGSKFLALDSFVCRLWNGAACKVESPR